MMEGVGVQVIGLPNQLSIDKTIDKLTIHFLRKRNGGSGEDLRVIYPTHCPGHAIVIFEEPKVASRVLKQAHVVDFGHGHKASVEVRAADRPEVDMSVKTDLDLSMFCNSSEVRHLLKSHGFQITELGRDRWHLTGSFMKLTAVKASLEHLLVKYPSSSSTINGHGYPHGATSSHCSSGTTAQFGSRSPAIFSDQHAYSPSPSYSPLRGSGSQQSLVIPLEHVAAQSPGEPQSRDESPFIITADVLHYAQCLRKKDIQMILETNKSEMNVETFEGSDLIQITVVGQSSRVAKQKLRHLLNELIFNLRTQDIELVTNDSLGRVKVSELIQAHQDEYPLVVITHKGNIVRLTGPSTDTFDFKKLLLGKPDGPKQTIQRGRFMDRGSGPKRSSSLPRMRTQNPAERHSRPVASGSPNAQNQENHQPPSATQAAVAQAKEVRPFRGRSLSESRGKVREQRDTRKLETLSTVLSSEASSPRERMPSLISKIQSMSYSDIKRKLSRKNKMPESSS